MVIDSRSFQITLIGGWERKLCLVSHHEFATIYITDSQLRKLYLILTLTCI